MKTAGDAKTQRKLREAELLLQRRLVVAAVAAVSSYYKQRTTNEGTMEVFLVLQYSRWVLVSRPG